MSSIGIKPQQATDGTKPKRGFRPCNSLIPWVPDKKSSQYFIKSNKNMTISFHDSRVTI